MLACMQTGTPETPADHLPLTRALRDELAELLQHLDTASDALEFAGIELTALDDLQALTEAAIADLDVLLDLGGDPGLHGYWLWRVQLLYSADQLRAERTPAEYARLMKVHERVEARFPGLADRIAREAAWTARTLMTPPRRRLDRLERAARRALSLLAGEAA